MTHKITMPNMDNFHVDITARGFDDMFQKALELVLFDHSLIEGYRESPTKDGTPTLYMYWLNTPDISTAFPYKMRIEQLMPFVKGWLEQAEYGKQPDIDGHCTKGWRIFNTEGIQDGWSRISFAVQPVWAIHHK